ncbi:DUF2608 domain-containing protein [Candidatus Dependentiae bacterium]|jgi:hypothetical protein|nr:DUF2608 domain-containing protein [Candidatus Dependentiae bacterium]
MKSKKIIFYAPLLFVAIFIFGHVVPNIIESDDICNVENYVVSGQGRPIVIFDIDNTLLHPQEIMARVECVIARRDQIMKSGLDMEAAYDKVLPAYFAALQKTAVTLVDEKSVDFIKQLQSRGIIIIAMTARSLEFEESTLRQLDSVGINFCATAPILKKDLSSEGLNEPISFKNGIIFAGGTNDKGAVLERFLQQAELIPDRGKIILVGEKELAPDKIQIILIDDKEKNLIDGQRKAIELGIPFTGIRYSKLDLEVQRFNADPAMQAFVLEASNYYDLSEKGKI